MNKRTNIILLVSMGLILIGVFLWKHQKTNSIEKGKSLNQKAWESSFLERGLFVPPKGPREGFWGSRLGKSKPDQELGWIHADIHIPGLVEIDQEGIQRFIPKKDPEYQILIIGGSVAWGAYASSIENTYFSRAGNYLEGKFTPVEINVIAGGAWKSRQDFRALKRWGPKLKPDLVIFFNGLNDLTNGARANTAYGQKVTTKDGSEWNVLYHEHDYSDRVEEYLKSMKRAFRMSQNWNAFFLVVLQPSLTKKKNLTRIEKALLKGALLPHKSKGDLIQGLFQMKQGLEKLEKNKNFYFLDLSDIFIEERKTVFSDIWHFSDYGHDKVAQEMTKKIIEILTEKEN